MNVSILEFYKSYFFLYFHSLIKHEQISSKIRRPRADGPDRVKLLIELGYKSATPDRRLWNCACHCHYLIITLPGLPVLWDHPAGPTSPLNLYWRLNKPSPSLPHHLTSPGAIYPDHISAF